MKAAEPTIIGCPTARVLFWDGDGIELPDPGVRLRFKPAGSTFGNSDAEADIEFDMDLGVLSQTVLVDLPLADLDRLHRAITGRRIAVGEQVVNLHADELVRVTAAADESGTLLVIGHHGEHRVHMTDVARPQSWAPGHEPQAQS